MEGAGSDGEVVADEVELGELDVAGEVEFFRVRDADGVVVDGEEFGGVVLGGGLHGDRVYLSWELRDGGIIVDSVIAHFREGKLMTRRQQPALILFAVGMLGLGILALIYGDFALVWQPVAAWVPGRTALAYLSGIIMLVGGAGLLFDSTAKWSVRILFPYLIVWTLLKVPALVIAPKVEGVWLGFGELAVLLAGGWTLFAVLAELPERSFLSFVTGERGVRLARIFFAVWVFPIGLAHIMYVKETAALVPAWLHFQTGWAYLTGFGQIACSLGVLFSIFPRVAAAVEAGMISLFALLVWAPAVLAAPKSRFPWTALLISWAIAAGAWVVAQNIGTNGSDRPKA